MAAARETARLADAEQLAAAKTALAKLRRSEREVLTLGVWSGLSYAEAAEALNVPVGTVKPGTVIGQTMVVKRAVGDAKKELPGGGRLR